MTTQQVTTQGQRDEMTFNMYVDCYCNASETARQMGISPTTVRARVRRHSVRMARERRS